MSAPWDRRTPSEQLRIQGQVLTRWLPSAATFAGHWSRVAAQLGLEPDVLKEPNDLLRFPPSRERDLVGGAGTGAAGLVMRPTQDQVKAVATSRSLLEMSRAIRRGGQAALRRRVLEEFKPVHVHQQESDGIAVAYSRRDLDRLHLVGARAATVLGLGENDYLVSAVPAGPDLDHWGTYHLGLGSSMLALHPRGHGDGLDVIVSAFGLLPTTAVAVRADEAIALADLLGRADATVSRVHTVVCLGPIPAPEEREEIAEAWHRAGAPIDVRVLALWAPPEARSLWAEQHDNPGSLVTYPDLELLEVVDPLTGLVTQGPGDLTISSIGWTGTTYVRYQTGAFVGGLSQEPDPVTGRTVPRIVGEQQLHAWQPILQTADGARRVDLRGVAATVGAFPDVRTWIVELRKPTSRIKHDRVVVDLGGEVGDGDLEAISRLMPDAIGVEPEQVRRVSEAQVRARQSEAGTMFVDLR